MNTKILCLFLVLCTFSSISFAQNTNLIAFTLPPELKKDANAVIRENNIEITIEDIHKMVVKERRVTTVLNKLGNKHIDTYLNYDNDTKIINLTAKVYNSFGKEIKKFSKNKFIDVSAVDGGTLYSDARVKYIEYTPTEYPYTVIVEKEYKTSSTGFIPKWYPQDAFYLSVQRSEYTIHNPQNIETRVLEQNIDGYSIKKLSENNIHYVANNIPALKYEQNTISFHEITPSVSVALNQFTLKGVHGNGKNWDEFGKWMYFKLLEGRTALNPATIEKVKNLVSGIENDIEKAKKVYDFVQKKTRYISVQIGIGGWQPISAQEVDKLGYGDCKGLTNYTKALLDVVGITSYHTIVYADEKRNIDKNFTSIQGNHMILNIPNHEKDIWLECTSQTKPFGFLGEFTHDRDVLVVTPEGGIIKRTPTYKNEFNSQDTKANINLDNKGNISATVNIISKGTQYDDKYSIESLSKDDLAKYYTSKLWFYNNNLDIISTSLTNDKEKVEFKENIKVKLSDYATTTENELMLRVNVFNKNAYVPKRYRNRNLPLRISSGYKDVDEYTFLIPESYTIGMLPEKVEINNKFGSYTMELLKIDSNTLRYKKTFILKEGTYPKEDYKLYRKFRKRIAKKENLRIVLPKK